jgi:hypothetical protein
MSVSTGQDRAAEETLSCVRPWCETSAVEEKKFWEPPRSRAATPVVAEVDPAALEGATKAKEPLPVFVILDYDNGQTHEIPGFAYGWTHAHVLVSVPWPMEYYEGRKEVWVEASRVRRRKIDRRW